MAGRRPEPRPEQLLMEARRKIDKTHQNVVNKTTFLKALLSQPHHHDNSEVLLRLKQLETYVTTEMNSVVK